MRSPTGLPQAFRVAESSGGAAAAKVVRIV